MHLFPADSRWRRADHADGRDDSREYLGATTWFSVAARLFCMANCRRRNRASVCRTIALAHWPPRAVVQAGKRSAAGVGLAAGGHGWRWFGLQQFRDADQ